MRRLFCCPSSITCKSYRGQIESLFNEVEIGNCSDEFCTLRLDVQKDLFEENIMLIVHVFVHVKPDQVEAFRAASIENARNSVQEPGIARFDVIQQQDDPTRFVLVEVYRTSDDPARHKETVHYQKWRDTASEMMAEPRTSVKYANVFPDEQGWG
jgi:autoinducer 2-degrading protein